MGLQFTADEFLLLTGLGRRPAAVEAHNVRYVRPDERRSSDLTDRALTPSLIVSDTSVEAALEPLKLSQGIRERNCKVSGRFAVQSLGLD
jgi:hypothetical protein